MAATSRKRRLTFEAEGIAPFTMAVFPNTTSTAVVNLVASKLGAGAFECADEDGDLVAHSDLSSLPTGTYKVKKVGGGAAPETGESSSGSKRKMVDDGSYGEGKRKKRRSAGDEKESQLLGTRFLKRDVGYGVFSYIVRSYDAKRDVYICNYGTEPGIEAKDVDEEGYAELSQAKIEKLVAATNKLEKAFQKAQAQAHKKAAVEAEEDNKSKGKGKGKAKGKGKGKGKGNLADDDGDEEEEEDGGGYDDDEEEEEDDGGDDDDEDYDDPEDDDYDPEEGNEDTSRIKVGKITMEAFAVRGDDDDTGNNGNESNDGNNDNSELGVPHNM